MGDAQILSVIAALSWPSSLRFRSVYAYSMFPTPGLAGPMSSLTHSCFVMQLKEPAAVIALEFGREASV